MLGRPQKKVKGKPVNRLGAKPLKVETPVLDIDEVTRELNCSRAFLLLAVNSGLIRVVQSESQAGSMLYCKPDVVQFREWLGVAAARSTTGIEPPPLQSLLPEPTEVKG